MNAPDKALLEWLEQPSADRGLHFAAAGDSWDFWSYAALADLTLRAAAALHAHGLRHGDVVAVVQRSSPGFAAGWFGAIAAGGTACSIAPPFAFQRADDYEKHATHLFETAQPAVTLCDEDSIEKVRKITADLGLPEPVLFDEFVADVAPAEGPFPAAEFALLQFTSGSSGFSRGVQVTNAALRANVTAMRRWLDWSPDLPGIAWLPVHHDMGLIGCLINIVTTGCDGWMLQPEDFIRSPERYLRCISEHRVGLAAMPNFGLAYILRRIKPQDLEGLRFDSLRSIILGAERIDPTVLEKFHELLSPYGFDRRALLPAYGGAEATLAVTGLPIGEGWTALSPEHGGAAATAGGRIVGCGRPLEGVSVTITDDDERPVPDGTVGEIVVTGASVATSYVGDPGSASGTSIGDGTLRTGDAGFLHDGQLFVVGRLGDGLKVRGRMVFAESLEAQLVERGIPERRVAVLLGHRDGVPKATVVLEAAKPDWYVLAGTVLRESLPDTELTALAVSRGGIAVTSSGKPRRRVMWAALCDGSLPGSTVTL
ncbi:AMP-binding protein [Streptomyces sp. NPDC006335]|uniref:AMP-binding protein n=1 Tax=Streptomyces sp. NPDC006335 TaxID=3156895 RepID=UPI0033A5F7C3